MTGSRVGIFICGAAKSGTQLLVSVLRASGGIDTPRRYGEPNFFTMRPELGLDWYHGLFEKPELTFRGESSPTYMFKGRAAAERILTYNPDARFVFILRDPIARAWSHYWANRRKGPERLPPLDAFRAEGDRISRSESARYRFSYAGRGRYGEQLAAYRAMVGADRMHVIIFEDYVADPESHHVRLERFLELPEDIRLPVGAAREKVNAGGMPRFLRTHHLLARHKRHFWYTEPTRQLWTTFNHLNVVTWGRPYPKIDSECAGFLADAVREDRARLVELMGWERDPWPKRG